MGCKGLFNSTELQNTTIRDGLSLFHFSVDDFPPSLINCRIQLCADDTILTMCKDIHNPDLPQIQISLQFDINILQDRVFIVVL